MARRRPKAKPLLCDHVVAFKGRFLMPVTAGCQYTDFAQFAARTTRETALGYLQRGPEYTAHRLDWDAETGDLRVTQV